VFPKACVGVYTGPTRDTQELRIWGGTSTHIEFYLLDIVHSFIYGKGFSFKIVKNKFPFENKFLNKTASHIIVK